MHEDLAQQVDGQEKQQLKPFFKAEKDEAEFEAEMLNVANEHEAMLQAEKQNEEAERPAKIRRVSHVGGDEAEKDEAEKERTGSDAGSRSPTRLEPTWATPQPLPRACLNRPVVRMPDPICANSALVEDGLGCGVHQRCFSSSSAPLAEKPIVKSPASRWTG